MRRVEIRLAQCGQIDERATRQPVERPLGGKEPNTVPRSLCETLHSSSIPSGNGELETLRKEYSPMARNRKKRRRQHESAWLWKQTDCWYCTEPGTKKRGPLFDEKGERIRGQDNRQVAGLASARIRLADELSPPIHATSEGKWTVAKVCDVYLADLHRTANPEWAKQVEKWLNVYGSSD
jgi:hypothetical protein